MTDSAIPPPAVRRTGLPARFLRLIVDLTIGTLLCLTPVTSVLVLGWLRRRMAAASTVDGRPREIGWIMGPRGQGTAVRLAGGLAANVSNGLGTAFSLALVTLPFGGIWALAWWAGWTNSFTKGYEQAAAGPSVFLFGVGLFLVIWMHLPMALAHQAATGRALAFFDVRAVRRATARGGWRLVVLSLATLLLALPLFASRGLVVFASEIVPGFDDMSPQQVADLAETLQLVVAAYTFAALWFLRGWAARIYRRSLGRDRASAWALRLAGAILILAAGVAFAFVIVVGQFLNHSWIIWLTHPFLFLPWWG